VAAQAAKPPSRTVNTLNPVGAATSASGRSRGPVHVGEIPYDADADRVQCQLCGKWFRFIGGTHLTRTHDWTLSEYREAFHLPASMATCSRSLSATRRAQTLQRIADGELSATGSLADEAVRRRANANRHLPLWRSLAANHPELVLELHPTRNGSLDPKLIAASSSRKLWWCCGRGHEWRAAVAARSSGRGCPACANVRHGQRLGERNQRVEPDRTLAVRHPALFRELHPTRNGAVDTYGLAAGSARIVWWLCPKGHEWQARVVNRSAGTGCPACAAERRVATRRARPERVPYERSLAAKRPELVAQLHPTRNEDMNPKLVSAGSTRRVWWLCPAGHEWQARVTDRTRGAGCPICARTRGAAPGRSLTARRPELVDELHPTHNGIVDPEALPAGSNRTLWWRCGLGHEWRATVAARVRGTGCPTCARQAVPADRTLASKRPDLLEELHPTRNRGVDPASLAAFSNRKVWWRCSRGHEWESRVASRTAGAGCPTCWRLGRSRSG
jgi:hypothetical protein